MRFYIGLSSTLALAAFVLSGYCFLHFPIQKVSTQSAVSTLERVVIDRSRLSAEQIKTLDWELGWIRQNDESWRMAHGAIWKAGVFGFAGIGIGSLLLAVLAFRAMKGVCQQMQVNRSLDTDAQVRPAAARPPFMCAGQLRR